MKMCEVYDLLVSDIFSFLGRKKEKVERRKEGLKGTIPGTRKDKEKTNKKSLKSEPHWPKSIQRSLRCFPMFQAFRNTPGGITTRQQGAHV